MSFKLKIGIFTTVQIHSILNRLDSRNRLLRKKCIRSIRNVILNKKCIRSIRNVILNNINISLLSYVFCSRLIRICIHALMQLMNNNL